MSVVIIRQDGKIEEWRKVLQNLAPEIAFYSYLEDHPKEEIEAAMVWKHPKGIFNQYSSLSYIASFGAGVDFLLADKDIDSNIPITRVVDPVLASDMSEFVVGAILASMKNFHQYSMDQSNAVWKPQNYRRIDQVRIGILGMGALGLRLAKDLVALGFNTSGWSNSHKSIAGVRSYAGDVERAAFLSQSDIIVCLLPLTPATTGILDRQLFEQLPKGAYVINVARGGHLVDRDLLEMLNTGHLSGACLDVYHQEPLDPTHPFWKHPKIFMTPHVASVSDADAVAPQLVENYKRFKKGLPLLNQVSTTNGY